MAQMFSEWPLFTIIGCNSHLSVLPIPNIRFPPCRFAYGKSVVYLRTVEFRSNFELLIILLIFLQTPTSYVV